MNKMDFTNRLIDIIEDLVKRDAGEEDTKRAIIQELKRILETAKDEI